LSVLSKQALAGRIADEAALRRGVASWSEERTAAQKGVAWQFTTADARIKLARLYPTVIA